MPRITNEIERLIILINYKFGLQEERDAVNLLKKDDTLFVYLYRISLNWEP